MTTGYNVILSDYHIEMIKKNAKINMENSEKPRNHNIKIYF